MELQKLSELLEAGAILCECPSSFFWQHTGAASNYRPTDTEQAKRNTNTNTQTHKHTGAASNKRHRQASIVTIQSWKSGFGAGSEVWADTWLTRL